MGLTVSFDLDDADLEHFRRIMLQARNSAAKLSPEQIVASATTLLNNLDDVPSSGFIAARLRKLRLLLQMISDVQWGLSHEEVVRVLHALAYFTEPDDLIPDGIPGLGYLDDAIMIELVVRELQHELQAYEEFCQYRESTKAASSQALREVRDQLMTQIAARRQTQPAAGSGLLD